MAESPDDPPPAPAPPPAAPVVAADLPQPRLIRARRWNVSLVWLVPAIALAIAASMLVRSVFLTGPRIEIEFKSAEGVEAGKTEVRYKDVIIGKVVAVSLRDDRERVVVVVQPALRPVELDAGPLDVGHERRRPHPLEPVAEQPVTRGAGEQAHHQADGQAHHQAVSGGPHQGPADVHVVHRAGRPGRAHRHVDREGVLRGLQQHDADQGVRDHRHHHQREP
jgi:hypothetical protein